MPPVGFFGAAPSVYTSATGAITFITPSVVETGDVMLAVIAVPSSAAVAVPSGWSLLATLSASVGTAHVFRRIAIDAEPATQVFAGPAGQPSQPLGILAVYRGLDPQAAIVADAIANISPASTAFAAPTITTTTYSDLGVLAYYSPEATGTETFTMPAGATQRAIVHGSSGGGTIVLADYATPVGATGTKTATAGLSAIGLAANLAAKAVPTIGAPFVIPDVPGAIGLPTVGV